MSMKLTAMIVLGAAFGFGCKPDVQENSMALAMEPAGTLSVELTSSRLLELKASNYAKIDEVIAVTTNNTAPDSRTVSITVKSIDLMIVGQRCSAQGNEETTMPLMCESRNVAGSVMAEPELEISTVKPTQEDQPITAADLSQRVTIGPTMVCGLHYGDPKWQAKFFVSIAASEEHLKLIDHVRYDVFSSYQGNDHFVGSDLATGFSLPTGFLTPVSGWRTGPANVTLKSGAVLAVPGGEIRWTNPEPDTKPTGEPCDSPIP